MRHLNTFVTAVVLLTAAACSSDSVTDNRTILGLELTLTPTSDTLYLGGPQGVGSTATVAASATAQGSPISLPGHVFETTDSSIVTIASARAEDSVATVTARSVGTTTVTVRVNQTRASATIVVLPYVKSVTVTASAAQVLVGDTIRLTGKVFGWSGDSLAGQPITFTSSSPAATVTIPPATGTATATTATRANVVFTAPGTATITARSGAATATVVLTALKREFIGVGANGFSTGADASCGLLPLGRVYCFGNAALSKVVTDTSCFNDKGITASAAGPRIKCALVPLEFPDRLQLTALSVGDSVACGLNAAGRAYCWGDDKYGQMGNGGAKGDTTLVAKTVTGPLNLALTFSQVVAGGAHACGLNPTGLAYCWGKDSSYQLGGGDGRIINSTTPIPVSGGASYKALALGRGHTCALRTDGVAVCWGDNRDGQLGRGTSGDSSDVPAPIAGVTFTQISARGNTTCGVTAQGSAFCWGANESGQAGSPASLFVNAPTQVSGSGYTAVSVGGVDTIPNLKIRVSHTCALSNGNAVCWGANNYGQLGRGSVGAPSSAPLAVTGGLSFTAISAGSRTTCAVNADGAYCWGSAILGAMGNEIQALTVASPQKTAAPR
ncbi:MAG: hypothetical protein ABIP93_12660 [Gemmatimonadaceae bacterium]